MYARHQPEGLLPQSPVRRCIACHVRAQRRAGCVPRRSTAASAARSETTPARVLPGVTVTVTSVERGTTDSVVTNESGFYTKDRLLPGTYEVRAELQGFKQARVPSVNVSVDTQTPVDFTLALGELSETVEVTGGSPLLRTDRADVATTFDTRQLTDLPVLDRNFTKFVLLTPGTQQLGWQHAASENPQGSTQTMVNGQHFSGTTYQLDGTENRDPILGIIVINPTLESIRRNEDHLAELRRRVRAGDGGRRVGADQVGRQRRARQRLRVLPERQVPVAQSVHAVRPGPADRPLPAGDQEEPVRRLGWRTDREEPVVLLRRLRRDAQQGRRLAARHGADRRGAPRRFQRLRRGDFRSGHRRAGVAHAVCEQPDPAGPAVAAGAGRPAADSGAQRCPDARTARSTTTSRRDRRPSTPTPSTCASTDACATA